MRLTEKNGVFAAAMLDADVARAPPHYRGRPEDGALEISAPGQRRSAYRWPAQTRTCGAAVRRGEGTGSSRQSKKEHTHALHIPLCLRV